MEEGTLISKIEAIHKKASTTSLDLSFNELLDMYKTGELKIDPDFQRLFRWSEGARSRFIETLLLEMPVPPLFVIESESGQYELIDGLQRFSAYLHFRGELSAPHMGIKKGDFLELEECDVVPDLNGKTFANLGTALAIRVKRAFVRVEVIRKESDAEFRYHMFKRLNTGGVLLTDQQVRNCNLRLLDKKFPEFIIELSKSPTFAPFRELLTEEQLYGAFDQELVLRFFALKNDRPSFKHDVSDFLTKFMEKICEGALQFSFIEEKQLFDQTLQTLYAAVEDDAFARADKKTRRLIKGFGVYHFEAFTIGIQNRLAEFLRDEALAAKLHNEILSIKTNPEFIEMTTGGGKNSPGPLSKRIDFVSNRLATL